MGYGRRAEAKREKALTDHQTNPKQHNNSDPDIYRA